jgi:hypothetical protein
MYSHVSVTTGITLGSPCVDILPSVAQKEQKASEADRTFTQNFHDTSFRTFCLSVKEGHHVSSKMAAGIFGMY